MPARKRFTITEETFSGCSGEKGEGMICFALGFAYENGKGVKQDNEKAKDFYSKACQFKYDNGCLKSTMMISN